MLKTNGWNVNSLVTIIAGVQGAIHKHIIKALENLKIPPQEIHLKFKLN